MHIQMTYNTKISNILLNQLSSQPEHWSHPTHTQQDKTKTFSTTVTGPILTEDPKILSLSFRMSLNMQQKLSNPPKVMNNLKHQRKRVSSHKIIKIVKTEINQHFIELSRSERTCSQNFSITWNSWPQKHISQRL